MTSRPTDTKPHNFQRYVLTSFCERQGFSPWWFCYLDKFVTILFATCFIFSVRLASDSRSLHATCSTRAREIKVSLPEGKTKILVDTVHAVLGVCTICTWSVMTCALFQKQLISKTSSRIIALFWSSKSLFQSLFYSRHYTLNCSPLTHQYNRLRVHTNTTLESLRVLLLCDHCSSPFSFLRHYKTSRCFLFSLTHVLVHIPMHHWRSKTWMTCLTTRVKV